MLLFIFRWGVFCTLHPCCRYPLGTSIEFCSPLPHFNFNLYIIILVCAHKDVGFCRFLLCLLQVFFLSIAEYLLIKKTKNYGIYHCFLLVFDYIYNNYF